jgi:hypothetical protein
MNINDPMRAATIESLAIISASDLGGWFVS